MYIINRICSNCDGDSYNLCDTFFLYQGDCSKNNMIQISSVNYFDMFEKYGKMC